ncbi:MAG TPA: cell division protein SepF [Ilumatobacter sp.]|nr:cell division protein SepF [Ilumatobacter sp.]
MEWLGLGPDDAYDDYEYDEEYAEPEPAPRRQRRQAEPEQRRSSREEHNEGVVRTMPNRPTFPSRDFDPSQARRDRDDSSVTPRPQRQATPPRNTPSGEPAAIAPRRFDQAQELADKYKEGQPVIMNLESAEREVARRLIDFASGLCYALDGSMEKVANGVYLLKPAARRTDD